MPRSVVIGRYQTGSCSVHHRLSRAGPRTGSPVTHRVILGAAQVEAGWDSDASQVIPVLAAEPKASLAGPPKRPQPPDWLHDHVDVPGVPTSEAW